MVRNAAHAPYTGVRGAGAPSIRTPLRHIPDTYFINVNLKSQLIYTVRIALSRQFYSCKAIIFKLMLNGSNTHLKVRRARPADERVTLREHWMRG